LLGFETSDDAAVYRLSDDMAAVLTVDFFTPIVDDPFEFGCIAATNALSDIYAMGARPLVALNLLAASPTLGLEVVGELMRGGFETVQRAGAFLAGGHTIDDAEPKYGLAVFGIVHPEHIVRNSGARTGDILFYTKRLGVGIMLAALAAGLETDESIRPVIDAMKELNDHAATAMLEAGAHAATDVTGFGLAGHLHEMLDASGVAAQLEWEALPLFEGVFDYSSELCRPGRTFGIIEWAESFVEKGSLNIDIYDSRMGVICDPQTSGGLLVSLAPQQADRFVECFFALTGKKPSRIGLVVDGEPGRIVFTS
jgi:selenide,water dikinase